MPAALTVGVMAIAVGITGAVLYTRRDVIYALVVIWAFLGIWLKRSGSVEDGSTWVANAAVVGLVALGLGAAAAAWTQFRVRLPPQTPVPDGMSK